VNELVDAESMFSGCENFNQDLSGWKFGKLENMRHMFFKCYKFNSDLSKWDVSTVKNFDGTFYMCRNFESNLSKWKISERAELYATFYKCTKLNFKMIGTAWEDHWEKTSYYKSHEFLITKAGFKKEQLPAAMINKFRIK